MNDTMPVSTQKGMEAPDPILAELWEVKRQLNAEAGYNVANRAHAAHEAAGLILQQLAKRAQQETA